MKPFKVVVTPEQSEAIQKALFKNGMLWVSGHSAVQMTDRPYLYVDKEGKLTASGGININYFEEHSFPLRTFDSLMAELGKSSEEMRGVQFSVSTSFGIYTGKMVDYTKPECRNWFLNRLAEKLPFVFDSEAGCTVIIPAKVMANAVIEIEAVAKPEQRQEPAQPKARILSTEVSPDFFEVGQRWKLIKRSDYVGDCLGDVYGIEYAVENGYRLSNSEIPSTWAGWKYRIEHVFDGDVFELVSD